MLLGEKLIAFRDSAGRVGVMDHRCPHRCASLFLGRNEEGGIRPKADSCTAAILPLFDHLVGTRDQRLRHGESERLRGFEIDYQLILCRRLYRQIARLLAF